MDAPPKQAAGPAPAVPEGESPDRELVERAQKGDGAAFALLVGRHQRQLYRLALMRLRRKRRAPDSLPEQPLELTAPKFSADGNFDPPPRSDWSQRADDKLLSRELGLAIDTAVKALPEDYRTVFLLKDVDGLSNEEIASALELTVPAVKSRLHRARLALRGQLGEFFGEG
jgi:RNA polymerase sigma factor (sigma-70 family)